MNFFYAGSLNTFSPISYMSRSEITAIRPLIYVPEKDIRNYVKRSKTEVMPKVCPNDGHTTREDMKELINNLHAKLPYIRSNMLGAIERNNINGWKQKEK